MLHKHQVRLLAIFGHEVSEPFLELHRLQTVILRERWIGDDSIKPTQFTVLVQMQWFFERIAVANVRTANAMQQHIHFADSPCATIEFLSGEFKVARITADFLNMFLGTDQHTARTNSRSKKVSGTVSSNLPDSVPFLREPLV